MIFGSILGVAFALPFLGKAALAALAASGVAASIPSLKEGVEDLKRNFDNWRRERNKEEEGRYQKGVEETVNLWKDKGYITSIPAVNRMSEFKLKLTIIPTPTGNLYLSESPIMIKKKRKNKKAKNTAVPTEEGVFIGGATEETPADVSTDSDNTLDIPLEELIDTIASITPSPQPPLEEPEENKSEENKPKDNKDGRMKKVKKWVANKTSTPKKVGKFLAVLPLATGSMDIGINTLIGAFEKDHKFEPYISSLIPKTISYVGDTSGLSEYLGLKNLTDTTEIKQPAAPKPWSPEQADSVLQEIAKLDSLFINRSKK